MQINVRHRELNPVTVTHLSANRARRRVTSLNETNAVPLRQTTTFRVRRKSRIYGSGEFLRLQCVTPVCGWSGRSRGLSDRKPKKGWDVGRGFAGYAAGSDSGSGSGRNIEQHRRMQPDILVSVSQHYSVNVIKSWLALNHL